MQACDELDAVVAVGPNVDKPDMHSHIDFGPGLHIDLGQGLHLQSLLLAQPHYRTMLRISGMKKQQVRNLEKIRTAPGELSVLLKCDST